MFFTRLYDEQLAQASYLIGCGATGSAIVIDPCRHVDQYIAAAEAEGLRIESVTETHIHADFVSGTRELAARTGATMYLSRCGTPEWQYGFRDEAGVVVLGDRDRIMVGNVEIQAVHTPGHTPEHLSFLVTDRAGADEPMGIATGDFVFVGDVGRPDLLERAAHVEGMADSGARELFRSISWFKSLPDHLQLWPGHGAGSACGKGLSAVPQSTVGYERRFNWAMSIEREEEFVRQVLAGQPEPPRYFGEMKRINREGPPVLGSVSLPERVAEHRVMEIEARGGIVVDIRAAPDFASGHLPGTLSIPFNRSFPTWAGSLLPYDRDLYLLIDESRPGALVEAVKSLRTIGLDRVRGYFGSKALESAEGNGGSLGRVEQLTVRDVQARRESLYVLDVRGRAEWEGGHIPDAHLVPLAELPDRIAEVPGDRPIAVHCQGGGRSAIAASLLRAHGITQVANLTGGFVAWVHAGLPVDRD